MQTVSSKLPFNMRINGKIIERIDVTVEKSKTTLIELVLERKKKRNIVSNTFCDIDYSEVSLENDQIKVVRRPGLFTAFRPYGDITISLLDEGDRCKLSFHILPYGGNLPTLLLVGFVGLTFWTILVLLINNGSFGWIFSIGCWALVVLTQYLGYQYTRIGLIDYSKRLIEDFR